jgi:hypothetical protein
MLREVDLVPPPKESPCDDLEICLAAASCSMRQSCQDNLWTAEPEYFQTDSVQPRVSQASTGKIDFQEAIESSCGDFDFLVKTIKEILGF